MSIINRLATRLVNSQGAERGMPDQLTRDIGGHFRNNQPYISGYFQTMFGLPSGLFAEDAQNSSQWLHSTCESFTPHTVNLTKIDIMGQGQIGSSFVANVMTTREFTCAFREYQNMPILTIIRKWASVFDPYVGVSPLKAGQFIPSQYKGWCAILQLKPVGAADAAEIQVEDVEECYIYQGVFPTTIPVDTASAEDQTTNDSVQLSVTFSFDGHPLTSAENDVTTKVVSLFNSYSSTQTYDKYLTNGLGGTVWGPTPLASTNDRASS